MKLRASLSLLFIFLINVAFAQSSKPATDSIKYGSNAAAGKYADIRGFKMYYETYGQGEPLLIIHGNGGSIHDFRFQIPYFLKNYKVIIADSRAQGKSIDRADSLSYEMMTDDLNALLDKLNLKQCYVIGWSDGGINGLLMAIRHPDKVKKLAITGANLWPDTSAVDPFVYNYAFKMNKIGRDTIKKLTGANLIEAKGELKLLHLLTYEPHIKLEDVKKITCPTLVIGGDHDVLRVKHTTLIAETIPNSYLWILPNSGHSTPIYYKDMFNQVVGDFFAKPYRKIEGFGRFN